MRIIWLILMTATMGAAWVQTPPDGADEQAMADKARLLQKGEINRIRYRELRSLRESNTEADKARVNIPRDVLQSFLKDMERRDKSNDWPGPDAFRRLSPEKKLAIMARLSEDAYVDKVEIRTDPDVFAVYKRHVLPIIVRGCATANCHGGVEAVKTGLKLHDDPRRSNEAVYTTFLLLDQIQIQHGDPAAGKRFLMIDRSHPDDSLLLAWLLDPAQLPVNGPHHPGEVKVKPVFHSKNNPAYEQIASWIASLRHPHPDYGVWIGPKPSSAPAKEPPPQPNAR